MQVEFHKTGNNRYSVVIRREDRPELKMDPAPGFDPLMPHDLLHFLVEDELKLKQGIFGQIANGGTAGTFHQMPSGKTDKRADARQRRKLKKRGQKLLQNNTDDCLRSERATYVCLYDWLAHSNEAERCARAAEMKPNAESILGLMAAEEKNALNGKLAEIRQRMNDLSGRWANLKINESMSFEWTL